MERDFNKEKEDLFNQIGKTYNMVLSTLDNNNVYSRMVYVISYNEKLYITSMQGKKLEQIEKNPAVALCADTIQLNGEGKILGSTSDILNKEIMKEYKNILPVSFEQFASKPGAVLIEFSILQCKWWKNIQTMDGVIIDFINKRAVSKV